MRRGGHLVEAVLTPLSIRLADNVIAISQFTRSELLALFPYAERKINVIYEASDLVMNKAATPRPLSNSYFLFVGSNEPRKNLRGLLEGYRQYVKSIAIPSDLVIVGADEWGDFKIMDFVRSHGLEARIHVMRNVDDLLLSRLYEHAQACVLVSLYEGFGLPLVEAMQYGIPLIASKNSAMAEIAGNAALLVDPLDTGELAQAFCKITEREDVRRSLGSMARLRGQQFSWKKAASQTIELMIGDLARRN